MSMSSKIWIVIYRWKALDLCFSNKGAPILCLSALRPYWGIYGRSQTAQELKYNLTLQFAHYFYIATHHKVSNRIARQVNRGLGWP